MLVIAFVCRLKTAKSQNSKVNREMFHLLGTMYIALRTIQLLSLYVYCLLSYLLLKMVKKVSR